MMLRAKFLVFLVVSLPPRQLSYVLQLVNIDAGAAPSSSSIVEIPEGTLPPTITVTATAAGLTSSSVTLGTSVSWNDSVMAVAAANVGSAYVGE